MRFKLISLSLLLLNCFVFQSAAQDTLLLFHPTAYNLELVQNLMNEGVFSLEDYHVLGVFHERENYDYQEARTFLEYKQFNNFSLQEINGTLGPENIFEENSCSSQFMKLFNRSLADYIFCMGPLDMRIRLSNCSEKIVSSSLLSSYHQQ